MHPPFAALMVTDLPPLSVFGNDFQRQTAALILVKQRVFSLGPRRTLASDLLIDTNRGKGRPLAPGRAHLHWFVPKWKTEQAQL